MLPALPTEKPRTNKLAASSTSRCRVSCSFISRLQHLERLQEEVRRAEIARLQGHQQGLAFALRIGPGHAGIDLRADAQAADTQRLHCRARRLAARYDEASRAVRHDALGDLRECRFDQRTRGV